MIQNKVIILGNQKSGTSAIASLLGIACGLEYQIDIPCLWPPVVSKIRSGEINFHSLVINNQAQFNAPLLKEPNFTFIYDHIANYFNNCQFVFISREPKENIRSLLNRLRIKGNHQNKTFEDFDLTEVERAVLDPSRLGQTYSHYIEVLADRWKLATDVYLESKSTLNLVRYEDFCKNKEQYILNLADLLKLQANNSISDLVDKQFQSKGKKVLNYRMFYGAANFQKINNICCNNAKQMGYDV